MPINEHDYDSSSLEFVYAWYMPKNMPHICATYFTKLRIFSHILCLKKFSIAYFMKILHY